MAFSLLPRQQACLNAYEAACSVVSPALRRHVILIGGAASVAHGMHDRTTEDVDILVTEEALFLLEAAITDRLHGFHRDYDLVVKWDQVDAIGLHQFEVGVEFILLGGPLVPRLPEVVPFRNGYVASVAELILMRGETLVTRGDERDFFDFKRLLQMARSNGVQLPHLAEEQLEVMIDAVEIAEDDETIYNFMEAMTSFNEGGQFWRSWEEWSFQYTTRMPPT
jgi:hypothetical protein